VAMNDIDGQPRLWNPEPPGRRTPRPTAAIRMRIDILSGLRRSAASLALVLCILAASPGAAPGREFEWQLPEGFPRPRVPAANPMTWEKVELGRVLFYDRRLSGNQSQSCASCHQQDRAFSEGLTVSVGSTGQFHPRNSMALINVAYTPTLTWANPLLVSIEQQIPVPMFGEAPVELGLAGMEDELVDRLSADSRYRRLFGEAFAEAEPITIANVVKALASFVRTLISGDSPADRYRLGFDDNAISNSAKRGFDLFFTEKFDCFHCHGGFNFTDSVVHADSEFEEIAFHNNHLYNLDGNGAYPANNQGIFELTNHPDDMGFFKAPTLRNLAFTAPYMHDGSIATLEEVIDHYAAGGRKIESGPNAGDGSKIPANLRSEFIRGFAPTAEEKEDMINFLLSLSDDGFVSNPRFRDPAVPATCPGDCDFSAAVTVDELIGTINIALGTAPLADCLGVDASGDGQVSVDELVRAINVALTGCASS